MLDAGARLGDWTVEAVVGRGHAATVYRVRDPGGRVAAARVVEAARADELRREFDQLARVEHPGFVKALECVSACDPPYMVLELVEGESLRARLDRGPLPVPDACAVAGELLRALEHAHARGVVHGDLKPENVLLDTKGRVRLTDFGGGERRGDGVVSRDLDSRAAGGSYTPAYAPQEVLAGGAPDARADVYSFGVLLFELLTGQRPRPGASLVGRPAAEALQPVFSRCFAWSPELRFATAGEARIALDAALARSTSLAGSDAPSLPEHEGVADVLERVRSLAAAGLHRLARAVAEEALISASASVELGNAEREHRERAATDSARIAALEATLEGTAVPAETALPQLPSEVHALVRRWLDRARQPLDDEAEVARLAAAPRPSVQPAVAALDVSEPHARARRAVDEGDFALATSLVKVIKKASGGTVELVALRSEVDAVRAQAEAALERVNRGRRRRMAVSSAALVVAIAALLARGQWVDARDAAIAQMGVGRYAEAVQALAGTVPALLGGAERERLLTRCETILGAREAIRWVTEDVPSERLDEAISVLKRHEATTGDAAEYWRSQRRGELERQRVERLLAPVADDRVEAALAAIAEVRRTADQYLAPRLDDRRRELERQRVDADARALEWTRAPVPAGRLQEAITLLEHLDGPSAPPWARPRLLELRLEAAQWTRADVPAERLEEALATLDTLGTSGGESAAWVAPRRRELAAWWTRGDVSEARLGEAIGTLERLSPDAPAWVAPRLHTLRRQRLAWTRGDLSPDQLAEGLASLRAHVVDTNDDEGWIGARIAELTLLVEGQAWAELRARIDDQDLTEAARLEACAAFRVAHPGHPRTGELGEIEARLRAAVLPPGMRRGPTPGVCLWDLPRGGSVELVAVSDGGAPLWVGRYEVTRAQYMAFASATSRGAPSDPPWRTSDDEPVVNVTWDDAVAFCQWAGLRLPTEAEWQRAAGAGPYPWGPEPPSPARCVWSEHPDFGRRQVAPTLISGRPARPDGASRFGALDLAGNAWEWCDAAFTQATKVMRGGGWRSEARFMVVDHRTGLARSVRDATVGFRVAFSTDRRRR